MSSTDEQTKKAIAAVGGDEMLRKLRAKGVQSIDGGVIFHVPLLGGLVSVRVTEAESSWNVELRFDMLETSHQMLRAVPTEKVGLILETLFML